jgi:hypothetical protein
MPFDDDLHFEVYRGTFFGTSMYAEYILGTPVNNIFRHSGFPDIEYVIPVSTESEVLGTFFGTVVSFVAGEDGEPGHFTFVSSPMMEPVAIYNPTAISPNTHDIQNAHIFTQRHPITNRNLDFTFQAWHIAIILVIIVLLYGRYKKTP